VINDDDSFRGGTLSDRPAFKFSSSRISPTPLPIFNYFQSQIIKTPLDKNRLDEGVYSTNQDLTFSLHEGVTVPVTTYIYHLTSSPSSTPDAIQT
jgi:hypothetical protein